MNTYKNATSPGEILKEEFMSPLRVNMNQLALHLHVPPNRISEILKGHRRITADTALRLARFFGTTPKFWLNLQTLYDLEIAEHSEKTDFNNIHSYKEYGFGLA